jgi:hypothetical protein
VVRLDAADQLLGDDRGLQAVTFREAQVVEDRLARQEDLALVSVMDLEEPKDRSTTMMPGVVEVALSATSVRRLITRPGAVSMNRAATPPTGRYPRAVVPMNPASWSCMLSRNT